MSNAYLSVAEVAARWRVSKMTVYRLINGGELTVVYVGRQMRILSSEYDRYTAAHTTGRLPAWVRS